MQFKILLKGISNALSLTEGEKSLVESLSLEYRQWEQGLSRRERVLIRKYTYNSHDEDKPNRFFERLNRAMRGEYKGSDKGKLLYCGRTISEALCRQPLSRRIVCYRGVDDDLLNGMVPGTVFRFNQFVSTSVAEIGALKKKFKYVIVVPEGANGAYIENVSAFKGQFEFLLDYGCMYRLVAIRGSVVYLEVIA